MNDSPSAGGRRVPVRILADAAAHPELDGIVPVLESHATVEHVLEWCRSRTPPADLADVVVQDEFTHDLVLALVGDLYAVYDTT